MLDFVMIRLLCVLVGLAASAIASGYIEGREYVYSYEGQIYTGFPRIKSQFSGYAFTAKVTIQPHDAYAVVKIGDVSQAQFNGNFENVAKHSHAYVPLPSSADLLEKPFKVFRKNGIVTHFEVERGEPVFLVNVKRAIISLFSLNFGAPETSDLTDDNDFFQKYDPESHYYKVFEEGILGDCETAYIIEHHPHFKNPYNNIVMNVTKIKNYHKCNNSPSHVYSTFYGHECGTAEHEKAHTLHGNAQFHYDIRGHRYHYVIERIVTQGEVSFSPYPVKGQTVATFVNRNLTLLEERPVTTPLELGNDLVSYSSLVYEFDFQKNYKDPVDLKKPHFLFHLTGKKVPIDIIKYQFEELTEVYNDETYREKFKVKNFPAKFVELLRSVGSIGYVEIDHLYKAFADAPIIGATAEQNRYRNLFIDILVNSGTNSAFIFGKYLIENKKMKPQETSYFFQQFPLHVKEVSESLLDEFQELCENDNVKNIQTIYVSCLLSFSSVIYDRCVARYYPEGLVPPTSKLSCQPEDAIKYVTSIAEKFEQAPDENLKLVYLKAAGNIGLREIIPYVRPFIEGSVNASRYLRYNSIWSLRNVGFRFPTELREIFVPLLFNQTENYALRLSAFLLLIKYRPQLYELEVIARALKHDPDDQLRSYIYKAIKSFINSTHPCDGNIAKDAVLALRLLEDVHHEFERYDYSFSGVSHVGGYDPDYDYGGSTSFTYFASDTGYIPRVIYLGIYDYIGGKDYRSLGFGMKQQGLEKFIDSIIGPEGSLGKTSFFDIFKKRVKRDSDVIEKELNEIKGKISLPEIKYDPIRGEIFFYIMGNQISYVTFDDKTFEDFFRKGRFLIPDLLANYQKIPKFYYQHFMLTIDKYYIIPSEAGNPIIFDYKQPIYFYHKNEESSFNLEPDFFVEERDGKFPDHVKFETDGHVGIDKNLFISMSVIMPTDNVNFGVGINRRETLSLPLKMKFDLDVKQKSLQYKWTPVATHEIFHFKYEPFTYIDSYDNHISTVLEKGYLPVKRLTRKKVKQSFLHDTLGVGFDMTAEYENEFNDKGSWLRFFFEKDYREKFYYLFYNPHFEPYDINVVFSKSSKGATKEVTAELKYQYYSSEFTRPEFSAESFKDYKGPQDRGELYTCSLEAEIVGNGEKERKLKTALTWTRDLKQSYHKFNFYYNRTPFTNREDYNLKICGSAYLEYPKYDIIKLATLNTLGIDHTVNSELKLHLGKDCSSDQKIKFQGTFFTTDEQRTLESQREVKDSPEHYNPYARFYQECLLDREKVINYGKSCMKYIKLISTVHGYQFHAKHEKLSPKFSSIFHSADGFLNHALYDYGYHTYPEISEDFSQFVPSDEVHLHANFSLRLPVADIKVAKPTIISRYIHAFIPWYSGFRSYPVYEDISVKNSFSEINCKMEGDNVVTFDAYEYTLPSIDCYKIISKDCSAGEYFTVLATKINHPRYHKAVKIFLGNHKIEALPVTDESDIIIKVDGRRVLVTSDEPYLQHVTDDHHSVLFYVTHRDIYYALHSEQYGLIVKYDGHGIIVQVSPYYRNKLCGLCGNYNGQKYDGNTDAQGCYFEDENAHAYAYSIPSDKCSVPKVQTRCPNEGGFGCTKLRTKVFEIATEKSSRTCFSTEPIAECTSYCKASSLSSKKVSFHCLPTIDNSTKTLVMQQQHRVIHEVKRKSKDHEADVKIPDFCLKI